MPRICVYCGSSMGRHPAFEEAAQLLGQTIGETGCELIYGGGNVGLMGVVADAALAAGARVIGVIPHALLIRELGHNGLTELIAVDTMHERKHKMAELADAFIALPGGIGTMEEFFEVFTWLQLRFHAKPIGLLNTQGYYDDLLQFLDRMVTTGFLSRDHRDLLRVETDPVRLLASWL